MGLLQVIKRTHEPTVCLGVSPLISMKRKALVYGFLMLWCSYLSEKWQTFYFLVCVININFGIVNA